MTERSDYEKHTRSRSASQLPLKPEKEVAHSNLEALVAYYAFSLEDFGRAKDRTAPGSELPEEYKSYVHEQVHLLHSVATPFGLIIWKLRALQCSAVAHIMRTLRMDLRLPINLP